MPLRVPTIEPDFVDDDRGCAYFGDSVEVDVASKLIRTSRRVDMTLGHAEDVSQDLQRAIGFVKREARRAVDTVPEAVDNRFA